MRRFEEDIYQGVPNRWHREDFRFRPYQRENRTYCFVSSVVQLIVPTRMFQYHDREQKGWAELR